MPAIVKRSGHVAGSSARDVVVKSVKSTLGETLVHPRSMLPYTVADMASMAWPSLLIGVGAGQAKDRAGSCRRPPSLRRLGATRPLVSQRPVRLRGRRVR